MLTEKFNSLSICAVRKAHFHIWVHFAFILLVGEEGTEILGRPGLLGLDQNVYNKSICTPLKCSGNVNIIQECPAL